MSGRPFEELASSRTDAGLLILRRRVDPLLRAEVFEVKLDDEFLMSSQFTVAETELARLGLAAARGDELDVVVGGLGLGFTARASLSDPRVRSLTVVEALRPVIEWHERALVPDAERLTSDPRARLVHGDFFALFGGAERSEGQRFDLALVDIDHSPRDLLRPAHAHFYTVDGLRSFGRHLRPGGVFALWSDDPPDADFGERLDLVFASWHAHVVEFDNPYTGGRSSNTVYVATCDTP